MENELKTLRDDLKYYNDSVKEVATEILQNKISEYPVFIASESDVPFGEMILDKDDFQRNWSISVTTLEELVENGLISKEKKENFKQIYKDPEAFICVFMIVGQSGNFVFSPYVNKTKSK